MIDNVIGWIQFNIHLYEYATFYSCFCEKYEVLGLAVLARHRAGEEPGATQHMPQRSHAPCQSPTPHHDYGHNVLLSAAQDILYLI